MKVAIIQNLYPPYDRGGTEQVVKRLVDQLVDFRIETILITSAPYSSMENFPFLKIYRIRPYNIFFYPEDTSRNFFWRFVWHLIDIFNFRSAQEIKKILISEKPDLVHTHNLMGLGFLVSWVIKKLHLLHVHTVHDVQLVEPSAMILKNEENTWRYRGIFTKIYSTIIKSLIGSPMVVFSATKFLLDFYSLRGFFSKSKLVLRRNFLTFQPRSLQFKNTDEFIFIYVGQVEIHKGVEDLIKAFSMAQKEGLKARLILVGDGTELKNLQSRYFGLENLDFKGRIAHEELINFFAEADLSVIPSLCYENSPTAMIESMTLGRAVLASNINGVSELIKEGENGILFAPGNIQELKTKLLWCSKNREKIRLMGGQALQKIKVEFAGADAQNIVNLYQEILSQKLC